jgi:hypothetical protein
MREPEPPAVAMIDAEAADEGSIEAAIDERLDGLDGAAREEVMRRVLVTLAESDPAVLDALDDAATELRLSDGENGPSNRMMRNG